MNPSFKKNKIKTNKKNEKCVEMQGYWENDANIAKGWLE